MTRKRCPFCEKRITAAAMKCSRCGAQLQEFLLAIDPIIKVAAKPYSLASAAKVFLYCVIVVCGAICGVAAMLSSPAPSHNYASPLQNQNWVGYQTTAADLVQNYAAYEAAAKLTGGTSAIEVSGIIKSIGHDLFGETEIVFDAGPGAKSVMITLDHSGADAPSFYAGMKVSVRCENMTRILGPPTGQSCQLVR